VSGPRVILVHGIWMPGVVMAWMSARLREAGFDCETFAYHGVTRGPQEATSRLAEVLARAPTHVLAHSLGGLVTLQALREDPRLPVQRVVCLGAPLRGSGAVQGMRQRTWAAATLGLAAELLERGFERWDGPAEVGVIAGSVPHGLGHIFAGFSEQHDGSVAVDETRLPGISDHVVIPASHSGMLFSPEAARLATCFLRQGRFLAGDGTGIVEKAP
jgi:pimeloyl-ACP methyl ester carboxylesterase